MALDENDLKLLERTMDKWLKNSERDWVRKAVLQEFPKILENPPTLETTPVGNNLTKLETVAAMIAQGAAANPHGYDYKEIVQAAHRTLQECQRVEAEDSKEKILKNPRFDTEQLIKDFPGVFDVVHPVRQSEIRTRLEFLAKTWEEFGTTNFGHEARTFQRCSTVLKETLEDIFDGK